MNKKGKRAASVFVSLCVVLALLLCGIPARAQEGGDGFTAQPSQESSLPPEPSTTPELSAEPSTQPEPEPSAEPEQESENPAPEETPEAGEPPAPAAFEASETVDGITVTVTAPAGVFPAGARLSARKITEADEIERIESAVLEELHKQDENKAIISTTSFDITVTDEAGNEIQPDMEKGEVSVTFGGVETAYGEADGFGGAEGLMEKPLEVFHVDAEAEEAEAVETEVEAEAREVSALVEHFSIYTLTETATALPTTAHTQLVADYVYTVSGNPSITG